MSLRILMVSKGGDGAGVLWRLQQEGHQVSWVVDDGHSHDLLAGYVPRVSLADGLNTHPHLILFPLVKDGARADRLRKEGWVVLGDSVLADTIELDRDAGLKVARAAGLRVPEFVEVTGVAQAIAYLRAHPGGWVVKPEQNLSNALTLLHPDAGLLVQRLEQLQARAAMPANAKIVLQRLIRGIEVSTELWYHEGQPVGVGNGTMEEKRFLVGDLGPMTGCESSVVWPYPDTGSRLLDELHGRLLPWLRQVKYSGPLDLNAIVDDETHTPHFLEFTPRFGYSAISAFAELVTDDFGMSLYSIARGSRQRWSVRGGFGMAARVSVPPYPYDPADATLKRMVYAGGDGEPVWVTGDPRHWWPLSLRKGARAPFELTGIDGEVMDVSAWGADVPTAWAALKAAVDRVEVQDRQHRVADAGARALRELPKLREWGYDVPWPRVAPTPLRVLR